MAGLVQTIFKSIPSMGNIFLLFSFFIIVFGIIGMQLFGGNFNHQCVLISDVSVILSVNGQFSFCDKEKQNCPDGYFCTDVGNPDFNLSNFDNMAFAMLKTFELITLENWSSFMYQCRDYYNSYYYDLYCYCVVLMGAFVILNLMVAVQSDNLSQCLDEREKLDQEAQRKKQ
jgi:hypothetical protein